MKRILITGGFGFLGSHLIDTILEQHADIEITVVDDLSSNAVNPKLFAANKPIKSYLMTIEQYLNRPLDAYSEIYHLASIVGPAGVLPHSGKIAESIITDAKAIARLAHSQGARLVFVSTSEVYGGGQDGYCSEEMATIISPEPSARLEYAVGKLAAEIMLLNKSKATGLDVVIVRPFNIAGARQQIKGGFVLPRFLKAAQDGGSLTVFGNGGQVRALTDARDVAAGIHLAMLRGKSGEIYNIGNELNKTTISKLATKVLVATGGGGAIVYVDPREVFGDSYVEANDKYPDSSKARRELGWEPIYSLDETIQSAIDERAAK